MGKKIVETGHVFTDGSKAYRIQLLWYWKAKKRWESDEEEILRKFIRKDHYEFDMHRKLFYVTSTKDLLEAIDKWKNSEPDEYLQDDTRKVIIEELRPIHVYGPTAPIACRIDFCKKNRLPYTTVKIENPELRAVNELFEWMDDDMQEYVESHVHAKIQKIIAERKAKREKENAQ